MATRNSGNAREVPMTPRKPHDTALESIVQEINETYGLNIQSPDPGLTPSQHKELGKNNAEYGRWGVIFKGIRYLYYKRDQSLEMVLQNFGYEAKAASEKWIPKPRQEPGTLPYSSRAPRATTAGQKVQLEEILMALLNTAMMNVLPASSHAPSATQVSRSPDKTSMNTKPILNTGIPALDNHPVFTPRTPGSAGSKRPSTDGSSSASKRARNKKPTIPSPVKPFATLNTTNLDQVPSRQRLLAEQAATQARPSTPNSVKKISTGVNNISFASTNKTSFNAPTVFSEDGDAVEALYSQSTVVDQSPTKRLSDKRMANTARNPTATMYNSKAAAPATPATVVALPAHNNNNNRQQNRPPSRASAASKASHGTSSTVFHTVADHVSSHPATDNYQQAIEDPVPIGYMPPIKNTEFALDARLKDRMKDIFPPFPQWLHKASIAVAWEMTRIAVHNKVNLQEIDLVYNPAWETGIEKIWADLRRYDERFPPKQNEKGELVDQRKFKIFPPKSPKEAWDAATTTFETKGNVVVLTATLDWNEAKTGPLYKLAMKPLTLDQGCRLTRRFGADRFFEILLSSPTSNSAPQWISKMEGAAQQIIGWLTQQSHFFVGRYWRTFYTKDAGYRKPTKEYSLAPDRKPEFKDRVHFFAESGISFRPAPILRGRGEYIPPVDQPVNARTDFKVCQMLDWLLQIRENEWQPHLKLFSRIQLGLSKTYKVFEFKPDQIAHRSEDILSPAGKVMNDGIGRMSRTVARTIRDVLGLQDIPSAVQGRIGSAKGMWLLDVKDMGTDEWIETYPSQRKWECNWADPFMRTLEVRSVASELKSANLNLQLLPVLEACAADKVAMKRAISLRLVNDLQRQFKDQEDAFASSLQLRDWMASSFSVRANRVLHGHVPMLAGLPESKEETLLMLLSSGFDARKQKYMQGIVWDLQKQKTDVLKTKLNIKVGQSAYVYMVVDFWGVLEEGEVHLGFSSKFKAETENLSFTLLADQDILVARSPAHFTSDVQKVRAVFKPELHALKDVIVFPAKGDIPLADKLSGGDYDGDMAWVCWDPDIVDSFRNQDVPPQPDLSKYLKKDKTTFGDLIVSQGSQGPNDPAARERATYDMIAKSFQFAMQPNFLGICTNYKERLCYQSNDVAGQHAIILSTLVGQLVDQSKQGITFNETAWNALRSELLRKPKMLPDPAYKTHEWHGTKPPEHIIDYLKFSVAKPAIDFELRRLNDRINNTSEESGSDFLSYPYDYDLIKYHDSVEALSSKSRSTKEMLEKLKKAILAVQQDWSKTFAPRKDPNNRPNYAAEVSRLYNDWQNITLANIDAKVDPKMAVLLEHAWMEDPAENSGWALLKASTAFKVLYRTHHKFVFQMAGRQLCFLKALASKGGEKGDGHLAIATPLMWAGLTHDGRFVKQWVARQECDGSVMPEWEREEDGEVEGFGMGGYSDY